MNKINILKLCQNDFTPIIKQRGIDYYNSNRVKQCEKIGNKFRACVLGNEVYDVVISYDKYSGVSYSCDCPCDFPCKHIYATLLAISNHKYKTIRLKKYIKQRNYSMVNILKKAPADEVKKFVIDSIYNRKFYFNRDNFAKAFTLYLPKNSYWYYYNNLYNDLILNKNLLLEKYFTVIQNYLSINDFAYAFLVIKAIINAIKDSKFVIDDDMINKFLKIGVYLRIIYKKCDSSLKQEIDAWILEVENNKYYDNIYLMDIILSLK